MTYINCLRRTVTGEATRLLVAATRLNIRSELPFVIASAVRAINGDGDEIEAGINLDIECLRTRGAIEGFDYGAQIRQLQTMRDRMRNDADAYLQEIRERYGA